MIIEHNLLPNEMPAKQQLHIIKVHARNEPAPYFEIVHFTIAKFKGNAKFFFSGIVENVSVVQMQI